MKTKQVLEVVMAFDQISRCVLVSCVVLSGPRDYAVCDKLLQQSLSK